MSNDHPQYHYLHLHQNEYGPTTTGHSKVIKGEIHNVLSVMRADPHYASPSRFSSELFTTTLYPPQGQHPLIASLRDLDEYLTLWELNKIQNYTNRTISIAPSSTSSSTASASSSLVTPPPPSENPKFRTTMNIDALTYLSPFCTAISSRDVSAPITGAALGALHKFLLYGFIDPRSVRDAKEGLTIIARAIRHCSFEESGSGDDSSTGTTRGSSSTSGDSSHSSSFRGIITTTKSNHTPATTITTKNTSLQITDEEVVLKLLSLASLVLRSPSGMMLLNSDDVVGIFDTCLHVATRVGDTASGLLQSAAADALGGIVLVVFGRSGGGGEGVGVGVKDGSFGGDIGGLNGVYGLGRVVVGGRDGDDDDSQGSDDLWGETDPSDPRCYETSTSYRNNSGSSISSSRAKDDVKVMEKNTGITPSINEQAGAEDGEDVVGSEGESHKVTSPLQTSSSPSPMEERQDGNATASTSKKREILPAHVTIMSRLASLANPLANSDQTCTTALRLINIALETTPSDHLVEYPQILNSLQNTLCKHLLYLSTTSDLVILNQTLRVIFNLFNSIKHHLKVQLEVFLTSVHLRILDCSSKVGFTPEQREVALESLLEFCHEPSLMQDIYVNYDCDVQCTNLFDTICRVLASVATGSKITTDTKQQQQQLKTGMDDTVKSREEEERECSKPNLFDYNITVKQPLNVLNKLACEGILAVIDSIARRCERPVQQQHDNIPECVNSVGDGGMAPHTNEDICSTTSTSTTNISYVETESIESSGNIASPPSTGGGSASLDWLDDARKQTSKVFSERKRNKYRLAAVAEKFNEDPLDKGWIQEGEKLDIFVKPVIPRSVAQFLYSTPNLDKTQIGLYLSKGPPDKYPFHSDVMHEFVSLFDFGGMTFSDSLRQFLKRFRLPGEAQCIDRLMDSFAARLYQTQTKHDYDRDLQYEDKDSTSPLDDVSSKDSQGSISPIKAIASQDDVDKINVDTADNTESTRDLITEEKDTRNNSSTAQDKKEHRQTSLFRNSDAAFVLAFSTIMLNTDLHNPTIKDDRRMTLEQFIRNNRGINDGHNFPLEFMTELYYQIKNREIQVKKDLSDVIGEMGGVHQFGSLFSPCTEVVTPFFTSHDKARCISRQASAHESDMFISIAPCALQTLSSIFVRSSDDSLVKKLLKGFKQMAKICIYFELDFMFNQILRTLLEYGRDYISNTVSLDFCGYDADEVSGMDKHNIAAGVVLQNHHNSNRTDAESAIPNTSLASNVHVRGNKALSYSHLKSNLIASSADHKGLLSLDCALKLVKSHVMSVREAWPSLLQCIFVLREANALPVGFSDLDDFADSAGNILPPSPYALQCQSQGNKYIKSIFSQENEENPKSSVLWPFSSLLGKMRQVSGPIDHEGLVGNTHSDNKRTSSTEDFGVNPFAARSSTLTNNILSVVEAAKIDQVIVGKTEKKQAMHIFRTLLDATVKDGTITIDHDATTGVRTSVSSEKELIFEHHAVFALELAVRSLFCNRIHAQELFPIFMSKFETILKICTDFSDSGEVQLQNPYLMERAMVTILRSCIHMIDQPEMRPYLFESLAKLIQLPPIFLCHVCDRLACGMAIILLCSYSHLKEVDEWVIVGDLLDCCAQYESGRQFIFNGIASCIEDALPTPYVDGKLTQTCDTATALTVTITYEGASMFARLLLKFVFGSYNGDLSLSISAIPCLEKVYWYLHFMTMEIVVDDDDGGKMIPDEDLWRSICSAFYSIGLCDTPNSAVYAMDCLERLVVSTDIATVSDAGWLGLLENITSKQPHISLEAARIRAFHLLCRTLLSVLPYLVKREDNCGALTEIVGLVAGHACENLCHGRISLLFESTIEAMTNTINVMTTKEFVGDSDFLNGLTETLFKELEKVGGVGGLTQMVAFTTKRVVGNEDRLAGINHCL